MKVIAETRKEHTFRYLRLHYYHWIDTYLSWVTASHPEYYPSSSQCFPADKAYLMYL